MASLASPITNQLDYFSYCFSFLTHPSIQFQTQSKSKSRPFKTSLFANFHPPTQKEIHDKQTAHLKSRPTASHKVISTCASMGDRSSPSVLVRDDTTVCAWCSCFFNVELAYHHMSPQLRNPHKIKLLG